MDFGNTGEVAGVLCGNIMAAAGAGAVLPLLLHHEPVYGLKQVIGLVKLVGMLTLSGIGRHLVCLVRHSVFRVVEDHLFCAIHLVIDTQRGKEIESGALLDILFKGYERIDNHGIGIIDSEKLHIIIRQLGRIIGEEYEGIGHYKAQ